ncbi:MAG: hypothetical protein BroJett003_01620 [Planctomycetota bacterium]|nr:MAG: hypothetical protein BroJett003_01620 [Planctomycetota bacterium]
MEHAHFKISAVAGVLMLLLASTPALATISLIRGHASYNPAIDCYSCELSCGGGDTRVPFQGLNFDYIPGSNCVMHWGYINGQFQCSYHVSTDRFGTDTYCTIGNDVSRGLTFAECLAKCALAGMK